MIVNDTDLERLDEFLASDDVPESAMDAATLEGFLTALAIGPRMAMPSAWLPWVWDFESGKQDVIFASTEQANEMIGLIMGWSNQIARTFQQHPERFEPVFRRSIAWGASEWCEGFLKATQLFDAGDWATLWTTDALQATTGGRDSALATPFLHLGDDAGMQLTDEKADAQHWVDAIVPALLSINAHWVSQRTAQTGTLARGPVRRTTPKVGRNDPCPCGSGKKYKHCHGAAPTLH
jgi:uncharacterized protein